MFVGLLANTSDRFDVTAAAVRALLDAGAEYLIHCGDIGNRRVLDPLAGLAAAFVWGDRDTDRMGLLRHADNLGIQCFGVLGDTDLDGRRIAVTHGNDAKLVKRLVREQMYAFVLLGHAKVPGSESIDQTQVVQAGALDGADKTVSLLDTATGQVRVLKVDAAARGGTF